MCAPDLLLKTNYSPSYIINQYNNLIQILSLLFELQVISKNSIFDFII